MALYRVQGIVLRSAAFGEADRMVTLFTLERGKVRALAKGVHRPRSRLAAAVQPLTCARFMLWEGRIDGISQAEPVRLFRRLREDLWAWGAASYFCELVSLFWEEGQESRETYQLLLDALDALDARAWAPGAEAGPAAQRLRLLWVRRFELSLLTLAGYQPEVLRCALCGALLGPEPTPGGYSPEAGGLLCSGCRGKGGQTVEVSGPGQQLLRFLAEPSLARRAPASDAALREAGQALAAHIQHVLQRVVQSAAFLEHWT